MAFFFGDGFDLYNQITDCGTYWDAAFGGQSTFTIASSGRFAGSRGIVPNFSTAGGTPYISKTSGANDAVHHVSVSVQMNPLTGTGAALWLTLFDGATAQCTIVFRSDGAILLVSGLNSGTTLATYTGAVAAINTWYQFEIEVTINNATGSFSVRKNGNTSNDFFLGSLNTRGGTANNYANKIGVGSASTASVPVADDFLWRSDPSSVAWVGDIRCYTRVPTSDAATQFSRSGSTVPVTPFVSGGSSGQSAGVGRYTPFVAPCDGTVGSVIASIATANAANMKCTLFANASGAPGAILGSANAFANPVVGPNTLTFGTPPAVTRGTTYWVGFDTDISVTWNLATFFTGGYGNATSNSTTAYASFPVANPVITSTGNQSQIFTVVITPTPPVNAAFVADNATDYAGTYVQSNTVGQSDLYNLSATQTTPVAVIAVTTRVYAQKNDAGTRQLAIQLQSGATNVQTPSPLNAGSWGWIARNDLVDPNTGAAWAASSVNTAQIGVALTG